MKPGQRFTDLHDAHELYCLGHLIEAAVAHHGATGKTSLLEIVCRYADLVDKEFGPGGSCEGGYDGHQEVELALVKLARATGEARYRDLALRMIDARGTDPYFFVVERARRGGTPGYFDGLAGIGLPHDVDLHQISESGATRSGAFHKWREYNQSHAPVREQSEAVGHSVRLMYQVMAMADLAVDTDDRELLTACERLWESTTGTKMYVTGALGSDPSIEGFSEAFDLPSYTGYGETCAAIGLVMWAQRMANITGQGRYAEVMERALFNGVLSGVSADGTSYFYGNPLASAGDVHRHEWFGVACCPPNLARLLTSLQHYVYAEGQDELAVHLYAAGSVRTRAGGGATLRIESRLPADGDVRITVEEAAVGAEWTLSLRVPAWSFATSLLVNGETVDLDGVVVDGYARLRRAWAAGDVVELSLDLTPHRVWADPRVTDAAGQVALQRGPVVYCVEGVDHEVPVNTLVIPREAEVRTGETEPLSGLPALVADGFSLRSPRGELYPHAAPNAMGTRIRAVPYFAWANRGQSTMTVWVRES